MTKEDYQSYRDGMIGSNRMSLKLSIIPDKDRGDMEVVARLRDALRFIASDMRCWSLEVATRTAKEALQ